MSYNLTSAAIAVLRDLAQVRPGQVPPPVTITIASELGEFGFVTSNGHGGIEITEQGREFLWKLDAASK